MAYGSKKKSSEVVALTGFLLILFLAFSFFISVLLVHRSVDNRSHADLGSPVAGVQIPTTLMKVTASSTAVGSSPSFAIDGNQSTSWMSVGGAPQWIEINLGRPYPLLSMRLLVNQFPAGKVTHTVFAGPSPNPKPAIYTYSGMAQAGQWIAFSLSTAIPNVQYVRILTTQSVSSFIGWSEIQFYQYGPSPSPVALGQCGSGCRQNSNCGPGLVCYQPPMPSCPPGVSCVQVMPLPVCRNPSCINTVNCLCGGPTPTPTAHPTPTPPPPSLYGCNFSCNTNSTCTAYTSILVCANNQCKNPACPSSNTCLCPSPTATAVSTPTPFPTVVP